MKLFSSRNKREREREERERERERQGKRKRKKEESEGRGKETESGIPFAFRHADYVNNSILGEGEKNLFCFFPVSFPSG